MMVPKKEGVRARENIALLKNGAFSCAIFETTCRGLPDGGSQTFRYRLQMTTPTNASAPQSRQAAETQDRSRQVTDSPSEI